jgi:methyl-accepting chemotaxis protein
MSRLLGVAIAFVLVIISFGTWVIYRAVERVQDSSQWVEHTQEALAAIEGLLGEVDDADSAVQRYRSSGDTTALAPLERAERTIDADVSGLGALTRDSPGQQRRLEQLREQARRTLALLRTEVDATRSGRAVSAAADVAQIRRVRNPRS